MYCTKCGKPITQGEKFCANCGTAVDSGQMTQGNFNYNPQYPRMVNQSSQKSNYNVAFIIGVLMLIAGVLGALISVLTIASDINDYHTSFGYSYSGHLTSHEIQTIAILAVSLIVGFIGLIMTVTTRKK